MGLRLFLFFSLIGFLVMVTVRLIVQEPDKATKTKIKQRDQLAKEAQALVNSGELDKATELFERVYQHEQAIYGDSHAELLGTLKMLSQVAKAKQDHDAVVGYFERQQNITQKLYGADDYRTKDAARAVTDAKRIAALTPDQRGQLEKADAL